MANYQYATAEDYPGYSWNGYSWIPNNAKMVKSGLVSSNPTAPQNLDISWMKSQGYDPSNPSGGVGLAPGQTWQDWINIATGQFNPVSTSNPISSPTTIPRPANEPVNPPTTGGGYTYNPEDPGEIQWNYESPIIQEWQRTTQGPYTRQGLKSWMDKRGISVTPPTTSQPTVTQPTTPETPSEPAAVSGPVTPPTWLGNVPTSTAMKFSDPELSLRPMQAGGSQQLFPSFQMPSFNYPASNPRQGSKNWWEMDWG